MKEGTDIPKPDGGEPDVTLESVVSPRQKKWWLAGGGVVLLALLIWAFSGSKARVETVYTDGVSVSQSEENAKLLNVVWDEPAAIYPEANGTVDQFDPTVSADGLTMIFVKGAPKPHPADEGPGADLYIAFRDGEGWSEPLPLRAINTAANELGPALSRDGNKLFFYSDRRGGHGGKDIWVSLLDDAGEWAEPVNLGTTVNTRHDELDPTVFSANTANAGEKPRYALERLYFASSRPKGEVPPGNRWHGTAREPVIPRGDYDLFAADATSASEGSALEFEFAEAWRLDTLNTDAEDAQPAVTRRGDFLYFASNRRGGEGGFDIYRGRILKGELQPPENLGPQVNSAGFDTDPAPTMEGHRLLFSTDHHRDDEIHRLYYSTWREVFASEVTIEPEAPASSPGGFYDHLKANWWYLILLLLLLLFALLWLLKHLLDEEVRAQLSIMQKCVLASTAMHILLAVLFTFWAIKDALIPEKKQKLVEISLDDGALAAQKEEEALRKPMEANLDKASAAMPVPEQENQRPAAQADPVQPRQAIQPEAVRPDVTAIQPPELILPNQLPVNTQLPKLPNQIPDPVAPQMQQPDLKTAQATPVENQQLGPVPREVQMRPREAPQATAQPRNKPIQPPVPAPAKADSAATTSQLAKTEVDPAQLPPVETQLPQLEQPTNEPVKLETANQTPELNAKPDPVAHTAKVNPTTTPPKAAKPVTPANSTPAPSPAQTAVAVNQSRPADNPATPKELQAAKAEAPATQANAPEENVKLNSAQTNVEAATQKTKATSDAVVKPAIVTAAQADPTPAEPKPVDIAQKPATTAAAKQQPTETAAQPATLAKVQPAESLPESPAPRAENMALEKSANTAETAQQPAKASAQQAVKQNTVAVAKSAPQQSSEIQTVAANKPAAAKSAAAKSQVNDTTERPRDLTAAQARQPLPQTTIAQTENVKLEQSQSSEESTAQKNAVSSSQAIHQKTAAENKTAPQQTTLQPVETNQLPKQTAAVTREVKPTQVEAEKIETARTELVLPNPDDFPVAEQSLEQARVSAEQGGAFAKAKADQVIKPVAVENAAAQPAPTNLKPVETARQPAQTAAAAKPVADTKVQSANLPATTSQPLPPTTVAQVQDIALEQSQKTPESAQPSAKIASQQDVKQSAATTAKAAPVASKAAPVAVKPTNATSAANKSPVANTTQSSQDLKAAQADANLPPLAVVNPGAVALEGSKNSPDNTNQKARASRQQSILQAAAAQNAAAPVSPTQAIEAIAAAPSQSAAAKSPVAKTTDESVQLTTAKASTNLPKVANLTPGDVNLEQPQASAETIAAAAKVASQQALKPTSAKAESTSPLPAKANPRVAASRDLNPLMTTNAAPAATVQTANTNLAAARIDPLLPNLVALISLPNNLETGPAAAEDAAHPDKASADTTLTARTAQPSRAEPLLKGNVPVESAPTADQTSAQPQRVTATQAQETSLKTARPTASLPRLQMLNPGNIPLETNRSETVPRDALMPVANQQAVKPAAQANLANPQTAPRPLPAAALKAAAAKPGVDHQRVEVDPATSRARNLPRFKPTDQPVEPFELPHVSLKPGGDRLVAGENKEMLTPVSSKSGSVKPPTNEARLGTPKKTKVQVEESLELVGEIEMPRDFAEPAIGVSVRPLELATDRAAKLELPDVNILDHAPTLEAPRKIDDPFVVRHDPKKRLEIIDRLGGSKETEAAIRRSLDWFTANQHSDGHWDGPVGVGDDRFARGRRADHDLAATGMAMLAYMGWGAKHTEPGPYQKPLAKAIYWMARRVDENGDMRPFKGANYMYDQGIAAIAMAEAYSLTKDQRLRPHVERIVDFIVRAQSPTRKIGRKTYGGGWRYRPNGEQGYNEPGDMSVTGWQIMALKSARLGGIPVPDKVFNNAKIFMESVSAGKHKGAYGYTTSKDVKPAMIAEAMFCQQLVDLPPTHPRMQESAKLLLRNMPRQDKFNYYYWYYGCLAMHQHQGPAWKAWNARMRPIFLKEQIHKPSNRAVHGSWNPQGEWAGGSGRCIITAMATLSLEVYYRYLPLYTPTWVEEDK